MTNDFEVFTPASSVDGPAFTSRDVVSSLFKHRRIILTCFLVVTLLITLGMLALPPTYTAEGKVLVNTEQQGNPSIFSGVAAYREQIEADPVNRKLETEMELITTREISERVVRDLHLNYSQVYHKPLTVLLRPAADLIDRFKVEVLGRPEDPDIYGFRGTVKEFNAGIAVEPLKSKSAETTSNMIHITLKAADPHTAQTALQSLLEQYVGQTVEEGGKLERAAYDIVDQNLKIAAKDLETIREKRREFLSKEGANLSAASADISSAPDSTDFGAPSDLSSTPQSPGVSGAPGTADESSTSGGLATIGSLRARLVQAELKLENMRRVYTDESENVRTLNAEIGALKERIEAELATMASSDKTMATLDLEAKAAEQEYVDLRRKLEQISLFLKLNPAQSYNRQISEPPLLPKTSEWKKNLLVTLLGSLGGLMLGLGVAGFREYTDHRLSSAWAVEAHLGLKALAVISQLSERELSEVLRQRAGTASTRAGP